MISNGSATYTYNAENQLIATGGLSYKYDGDGKRVEKCTEGTTAGTCASGATGTYYWGVAGGETSTETDLAGNVVERYVFFNGRRIARIDASNNAMHYYFSDHLGTHSLVTDANGTMPPQEESDFYPYGGEIPVSGSDTNHYKFTGKERDTESGLDMFGARYYGSSLGRFMTPDWAAKPVNVPYAHFGNPQSLNLYSYVQNNPTTVGDPDGHVAGVDDAVIVTAAVVTYGALVTYYVLSQPQTQHALSDASRSAVNAISSLFHSSDNSKTTPAPQSNPAPGTQTNTGPTQAPSLPDDANVVRGGSGSPGGANSPEGIAAGTGTHPSGVTGFSAESAPGKSVEELSKGVPNGQVGCCTVGDVRAAGGDVVPTSGRSPNHATVTGLSPAQASGLLTPTVPNPAKAKPKDKTE